MVSAHAARQKVAFVGVMDGRSVCEVEILDDVVTEISCLLLPFVIKSYGVISSTSVCVLCRTLENSPCSITCRIFNLPHTPFSHQNVTPLKFTQHFSVFFITAVLKGEYLPFFSLDLTCPHSLIHRHAAAGEKLRN